MIFDPDEDIKQLWLPIVIYDSTDQKESTGLGNIGEWSSTVTITPDGVFTRSSQYVVDEIEIFRGDENRYTYTW